MNKNIERRTYAVKEIQFEAAAQEKDEAGNITKQLPSRIRGHAAVFNSPTDMGWFVEEVAPGFFANAIKTSDVRMLFNHNPNYVLGRTKAGTLTLREDERGLYTENEMPDTQFAKDLAISMQRGDIDQMSFAWTTKKDKWEKMADGRSKRTLVEAEEIFDTSVVTYPAYEDTDVTVAKRSHDMWSSEDEQRGVIGFANHGDLPKIPEGESWDATEARERIAKWASSDGSGDAEKINWGKYKEGFAWFDTNALEDAGSYKLPHHDIRGGQLEHHWRGAAAAMGALLGARGGVRIPNSDKEAAYNHLRAEYSRYGKTPPDYRTTEAMPEEERMQLAETIFKESELPDAEALAAEQRNQELILNDIVGEARQRELDLLTNFV